ncbi:MAG: beta-ketoacyl synthase chain length factor [Nevskiaceae bacterium]|jgi:hypothetical protein|nr:beta-ketoacyl synthase chain length factor [Nevskiaceae bacterium]
MSIVGESVGPRFALESWAAVAAGLSTQQQWLSWFKEPAPLARDFSPELPWMPAGLRRRVSPLGRAALNVLAACQNTVSCPVVFASGYGDLGAVAGLFAQLHRDGSVSPMGFSLAVHNAAVGLYSIAREDHAMTTSVAARNDLAESAFFEALGWLASGAASVMVVCCDDPVPSIYRTKENENDGFRYAWACQLRAQSAGGFTLTAGAADADMAARSRVEHPCLRVLEFLTGNERSALVSETGRYLWRRHA